MNKFVWKEGLKVRVMRPANAKLALEMAKNAVGTNNEEFMNEIEKECGPLNEVGYLGKSFFNNKYFVINNFKEKIGEIEPGDFFSTFLEMNR